MFYFSRFTFSPLQLVPLFININLRIGGSFLFHACFIGNAGLIREKVMFGQSILPQQRRAAINGGSLPSGGWPPLLRGVEILANCLLQALLSFPLAEGKELANPDCHKNHGFFRSQFVRNKKFLEVRQNPIWSHFAKSPLLYELRFCQVFSIICEISVKNFIYYSSFLNDLLLTPYGPLWYILS